MCFFIFVIGSVNVDSKFFIDGIYVVSLSRNQYHEWGYFPTFCDDVVYEWLEFCNFPV